MYNFLQNKFSGLQLGTGISAGFYKKLATSIAIGVLCLTAACSLEAPPNVWDSACSLSSRPQHPMERSYQIKELVVPGGANDIFLAGELTMPDGAGPFPGIVLLSSTGPQGRNEDVMGHKTFLVLSDYLTRHGYAVFRFDDRGYGQSSGDHQSALYSDFAADAAAVMHWLKSLDEIDAEHVGFIGHSQGARIGVRASRIEPVSFLVSLAGGVQSHGETFLQQSLDHFRVLQNAPADQVQQYRRNLIQSLQILRNAPSLSQAHDQIYAFALEQGSSTQEAERIASQFAVAEFKEGLDVDEAAILKSFQQPVLALYGTKDLYVSATNNAPLTLPLLSNANSRMTIIEGVNHFFAPAQKGGFEEMCEITITIKPVVLQTIVSWLDGLVG